MTARRRLARVRLLFQLLRARQVAWYRSRTGLGRAGVVLVTGLVMWAVLTPLVGPGDALWIGFANGLLFETVMALGERWTEPRVLAPRV